VLQLPSYPRRGARGRPPSGQAGALAHRPAYRRCLDLGAPSHFPLEEDRDLDEYYAFFVFDPDGLRVEVFCAKQPESAGGRWTMKES
jgi:hypothetical protein